MVSYQHFKIHKHPVREHGLYWKTKYSGTPWWAIPPGGSTDTPVDTTEWVWEPPREYHGIQYPARTGFWYPKGYEGGSDAYYRYLESTNSGHGSFQGARETIDVKDLEKWTNPNKTPTQYDIEHIKEIKDAAKAIGYEKNEENSALFMDIMGYLFDIATFAFPIGRIAKAVKAMLVARSAALKFNAAYKFATLAAKYFKSTSAIGRVLASARMQGVMRQLPNTIRRIASTTARTRAASGRVISLPARFR